MEQLLAGIHWFAAYFLSRCRQAPHDAFKMHGSIYIADPAAGVEDCKNSVWHCARLYRVSVHRLSRRAMQIMLVDDPAKKAIVNRMEFRRSSMA